MGYRKSPPSSTFFISMEEYTGNILVITQSTVVFGINSTSYALNSMK